MVTARTKLDFLWNPHTQCPTKKSCLWMDTDRIFLSGEDKAAHQGSIARKCSIVPRFHIWATIHSSWSQKSSAYLFNSSYTRNWGYHLMVVALFSYLLYLYGLLFVASIAKRDKSRLGFDFFKRFFLYLFDYLGFHLKVYKRFGLSPLIARFYSIRSGCSDIKAQTS